MGAFGRYLQARLGGTKHDVSTWKSMQTVLKTKKELLEEKNESDSNLFERIKGFSENVREKYNSVILHLADKSLEGNFQTERARKKFIKWRDNFLKTN